MSQFVHLKMHTQYSVSDSVIKIDQLAKFHLINQSFALGISDRNNFFAALKFYTAMRSRGIKPILGVQLSIIDNSDNLNQDSVCKYQIIAIALNLTGYQTLCELISKMYLDNSSSDRYIFEEWLIHLDQHQLNNIIIIFDFPDTNDQAFDENNLEFIGLIKQKIKKLSACLLNNNFYIGLQRCIKPNNIMQKEAIIFNHLIDLAYNEKIPVVAIHPIQFLTQEQYTAHEVRVCAMDGEFIDDSKRKIKFYPDQYYKSQDEMCQLFSDLPSAIANTVTIAKRANFEINLGKYFLPRYEVVGKIEDYLTHLASIGLKKRLYELFGENSEQHQNIENDKSPQNNSNNKSYQDIITTPSYQQYLEIYQSRLNMELATINNMGFAGYFLIVEDFINWSKNNHIPVGAGRGSGAGSLVAFSLGITDIDPIKYGLLFERFLNPERVSMPDFDIDFCQDKRELVIKYVQQKYGMHAVSQIATFGTMSSKAVIKDVGRVLGLPYGLCDSLSSLIQNTPAKFYSLKEAYEEFLDFRRKIDNGDDDVKRLWEIALQLEDIIKSVGKHAAGIIIAPNKVADFCPLYLADGDNGMPTSHFDKEDIEAVGLIKFDFLGLRNLTIIAETIELIKKLYNIEFAFKSNDFSDKKVYELMQNGNTGSVFQLESSGIRRLLIKLQPDSFEDTIAVLALYRPGPLGSGMVDDFINRKKGIAKIDYFHEDLTECLTPTYGIIVYQEQVMKISQIIGGYTLGAADILRRAMGKKKPEEMEKNKAIFINGATERGYTLDLAKHLFELMEKFAEYGFNKSHSAAYAAISYQTAYLKAHYLSCFMAATLSSELDRTEKLEEIYLDAIANQLNILAPDINSSSYRFVPIDAKNISYALTAIKGIGVNIVDTIINERNKNGNFTSFIDFCTRIDKKVLNKKSLESLIASGSFDSIDTNRGKLFANIQNILDWSSSLDRYQDEASNVYINDLFAEIDSSEYLQEADYQNLNAPAPNITSSAVPNAKIILPPTIKDSPNWNFKEKILMEKKALGFFLTARPLSQYIEVIHKLETSINTNDYTASEISLKLTSIQKALSLKIKQNNYTSKKYPCIIYASVAFIKHKINKNGQKSLFAFLEDQNGLRLSCNIYEECYTKYLNRFKIDDVIFVYGEVIFDEYRDEYQIIGNKCETFNEFVRNNIIQINIDISTRPNIDQLEQLLPINHTAIEDVLDQDAIVNVKCYYNTDHNDKERDKQDGERYEISFANNIGFVLSLDNIQQLTSLVGKNNFRICTKK